MDAVVQECTGVCWLGFKFSVLAYFALLISVILLAQYPLYSFYYSAWRACYFCYGKSNQNHCSQYAALRVPCDAHEIRARCATRYAQTGASLIPNSTALLGSV